MIETLPAGIPHRRRLPAAAVVGFWTALMLPVGDLRGGALALAAVLAASVLLIVLVARPVTIAMDADGLRDPRRSEVVCYAALRMLRLEGQALVDDLGDRRSRYLLIGHEGGVWRVPRRAGLDRLALYRGLLERSALRTPPTDPPPAPAEFARRARAEFGAAQVLVTGPRRPCRDEPPSARWHICLPLAAALACLPSLASTKHGALDQNLGLLLISSIVCVIGLALQQRRSSALGAAREGAHLVLSPRGLGLWSRRLQGDLAWAEVGGLQVVSRSLVGVAGLVLRVDGASIFLGDHFALPLTEIERAVRRQLERG
jgi:hypothetical protein